MLHNGIAARTRPMTSLNDPSTPATRCSESGRLIWVRSRPCAKRSTPRVMPIWKACERAVLKRADTATSSS